MYYIAHGNGFVTFSHEYNYLCVYKDYREIDECDRSYYAGSTLDIRKAQGFTSFEEADETAKFLGLNNGYYCVLHS